MENNKNKNAFLKHIDVVEAGFFELARKNKHNHTRGGFYG